MLIPVTTICSFSLLYNSPLYDYNILYPLSTFDDHCRCSSIFGKPNLYFHLCFLFCEMPMCPDIFPFQIQALLFSCALSLEDHLDRRLQCPQASILVHPMGNHHQMKRVRKKERMGIPWLSLRWMTAGWLTLSTRGHNSCRAAL